MIRRPALHFDEQFTTMPNAWLRDPRTTFATKGFLAHLLSHRPGWRVTLRSLAETYPEGIAALQTIVRNAVDTGYLAVAQQRDQGGRFAETSYDLCDPFASAAPRTDSPCTENPCTENPYTENPYTENPYTKKTISKKNISREEHLEDLSSPALPARWTLDEVQAPTELDPSTPARSTAPAKALDAEFPKFWAAYPRKAAKGSALRAYRAARRKVSLDTLIDALDTYQKNKPDWQDYAYPASWLNAERWEDQWTSAAARNTPPESRPVPNVDPDDVEAYIAAMTGGNR